MPAKLLTALVLICLLSVAGARAADIGALESKLASAKDEAGSIAAELRAAQDELAVAQQEAAQAAAREEKLSGLLAEGEERSAELGEEVAESERRLAEERSRLHRARTALAARLVAIYESGTPDEVGVILGSATMEELNTSAAYLERIQEADTALASRVEQVRESVKAGLERVAEMKQRADAYNARLASARSEISAVRGDAEAAAARLNSVSAARSASLAKLKSEIEGWIGDIEEAEAASREAAEEEVGRWLGGPYSIPAYIVMCESGGDYGALNSSSGAGGAYQIIPSTWALYGGEGAPQDAPKAEQDRIAAEIWADSGGGAWVCAG
ncbi:MAG TPA: transglycosylase family protein [Solirubrobacterales bacterium]